MEQLKIFGGIAAIAAAIFFFAPKQTEEQPVTAEPVAERGFSSKETSARFVAPTAPVEE